MNDQTIPHHQYDFQFLPTEISRETSEHPSKEDIGTNVEDEIFNGLLDEIMRERAERISKQ